MRFFNCEKLVIDICRTCFRYELIFWNGWYSAKIKLLSWLINLNGTYRNLILGFDITIKHIQVYRFLILFFFILMRWFNCNLSHNMLRSISQDVVRQKLLNWKLVIEFKVFWFIFWRWWRVLLLKRWIWLFALI